MAANAKESRQSSERRKSEHLRLLAELDTLNLQESCCDICHCDCLSSHRSTNDYSVSICDSNNNKQKQQQPKTHHNNKHISNNNNNKNTNQPKTRAKVKKKSSIGRDTNASTLSLNEQLSTTNAQPHKAQRKRSKSAGSLRSFSPAQQSNRSTRSNAKKYATRDCKILQELLSALEPTPRLEVTATKPPAKTTPMQGYSKTLPHPRSTAHKQSGQNARLGTLKLCESMANLCLAPGVRDAFQQVPTHDKKILNRMACKRSERAMAKENAWLARKYWENERYERELFKCEQMEEYKRAVRDKQFQDYLLTKERLNAIAQRDMAELQRLKESLHAKELRTKRRLDALRIERDMQLCQRRCDELRKSEAVTIQQEEQQLDDVLRKRDICQRLTERLRRADEIRTKMLDGYLKRLRYDNYLEQLVHEEHWRETQQCEQTKRAQLKEHISRKRSKSQRFVEDRQRQNAALANMAKISASLRELVRNSVTPESAQQLGASINNLNMPLGLTRLVIDRPLSKLSFE